MRVVIKPLGMVVLLAAIVVLAVLAFSRSGGLDRGTPGAAGAPVASVPSTRAVGSAPPKAGTPMTVFRDALENGWEPRGWAKEIAYDSAETTFGGAGKAVRVAAGPYEGVKIYRAGLNTAPYDRLAFRIHGGVPGGQALKVVGLAGGKDMPPVTLTALPPGEWRTVVLPLSALKIDGRGDANGFWIQNASGADAPPFFLDDIALLRSADPEPDGVKLPPADDAAAG